MNALFVCMIIALLPADRSSAEKLFEAGSYSDAREVYQALLADSDEPGVRAELLDRIGMTFLMEGDWWGAEDRFGASVDAHETPSARLHRARCYFYAGQAAANEPGAVGAEVRALMRDALRDLERCIELGPENAEVWVYKGLSLRYLFETEQEAEAYGKALELEPGRPDASLYLAYRLEVEGKYERARELLVSVDGDVRTVEHHLALGRLAERFSDFDAMREAFLAAALSEPGDATAYGGLWRATAFRKLFSDFEKSMAAVSEKHPDAYLPHYYLGFCRLDAGSPRTAVSSFEEVVKLNPDELQARFQIAETYRTALDDEETSVPIYLEVIRREPGHRGSVRVLAGIAFRRATAGEYEAAREILAALRECDPTESLHSLNLALVAKDEGRLEDALATYVQAEEDFPFEPRIPNDRGLLLMGMGREKEALDAFAVALDRDPDCLDALENLGAYARLHGAFDKALIWFRRAHDIVCDSGGDPSKFRRYLDMIAREGAGAR